MNGTMCIVWHTWQETITSASASPCCRLASSGSVLPSGGHLGLSQVSSRIDSRESDSVYDIEEVKPLRLS